jgi:hypothetical protein
MVFKRWIGALRATDGVGSDAPSDPSGEVRALKERIALLEAAVAHAPVAIALYDSDDRLQVHNPSYQAIYQKVWDTLPKPVMYADLVRAGLRASGYQGDLEAEVRRRVSLQREGSGKTEERQYTDGAWRRVTKQRMTDGSVAGYALDVSELKVREQQLAASLAQLQLMARETVPTAVTRFADANARMIDSTGIAKQLIEGTVERAIATGASAEQLEATISDVAINMAQASSTVSGSTQDARLMGDQIARLSEAVGRVEAFAGLIRGIANQTNLLALNATIEAARAGESGRGFAVVAAEVKALAQQTGEAAAEITAQVASVETLMGEAQIVAGRINAAMDEVSTRAAGVASATEEQRQAAAVVSSYMAEIVKRGTDAVTAAEAAMKDSETMAQTADGLKAEVAETVRRLA